jgi:hypothetical protein
VPRLEVVIDLQNLVASAKRDRGVGTSVGIAGRKVSGACLRSRPTRVERGARCKSGWHLGDADRNVTSFFSRNRGYNRCRIGR